MHNYSAINKKTEDFVFVFNDINVVKLVFKKFLNRSYKKDKSPALDIQVKKTC